VATKAAMEGMIKSASNQYPDVKFVVVRPPKLLTDMMNTPSGREGAISPEVVALRIITRFDKLPCGVTFIEQFN
jgi:hypothetical protein